MKNISLFQFFDRPQMPAVAEHNVLELLKEILNDFKAEHAPDLDVRIQDYAISTVTSNEYMPEGTALMHVYVLLPEHTITVLMVNKYAREKHANWVQQMARHTASSLLSHKEREQPAYSYYSLESHLDQHFDSVQLNGLKVSNQGSPEDTRNLIDSFEW